MDIGAVILPAFWMHFLYSVLNLNTTKKKEIGLYYLFGLLLIALNVLDYIFPGLFVKEVIRRDIFNYYPVAGFGYYLFLLFYLIIIPRSLYLLIKNYLRRTGLEAKQIKYLAIAAFSGFIGGGTAFLLTFNIPVAPYGIIFFTFYPIIIAYAVTKHHLFDIKVIATELLTFGIWVFVLARAVLADTLQEMLISGGLLLFLIISGILLIRSVMQEVKQREKIEKLAVDLSASNKQLVIAKEKEIQHSKEVEKLNEQQKSLMHTMNHQIKNFIGKARSIFAELLTSDYGVLPETAKPLLKEGFEQSTKGVEYVQGILRGASAITGVLPYDMKPMDARQVAEAVIAQEKPTAEEKGLSFESSIADGDYHITGDAVQLGEVFKNLIMNAVKYNVPNGGVKVDLKRENGKIIFSVKDTGVGVSDEDKPRLFTFGGMGKDSIKLNVEAAGFGLAFVKGVAEAHKGIAGYRPNDSGKGSTFFVELPVNSNI